MGRVLVDMVNIERILTPSLSLLLILFTYDFICSFACLSTGSFIFGLTEWMSKRTTVVLVNYIYTVMIRTSSRDWWISGRSRFQRKILMTKTIKIIHRSLFIAEKGFQEVTEKTRYAEQREGNHSESWEKKEEKNSNICHPIRWKSSQFLNKFTIILSLRK